MPPKSHYSGERCRTAVVTGILHHAREARYHPPLAFPRSCVGVHWARCPGVRGASKTHDSKADAHDRPKSMHPRGSDPLKGSFHGYDRILGESPRRYGFTMCAGCDTRVQESRVPVRAANG